MNKQSNNVLLESIRKRVLNITGISGLSVEVFDYSKGLLNRVNDLFQIRSCYHTDLLFYYHNHFKIYAVFGAELNLKILSGQDTGKMTAEIAFVRAMIWNQILEKSSSKFYNIHNIFYQADN